jgi:hypothetical protein
LIFVTISKAVGISLRRRKRRWRDTLCCDQAKDDCGANDYRSDSFNRVIPYGLVAVRAKATPVRNDEEVEKDVEMKEVVEVEVKKVEGVHLNTSQPPHSALHSSVNGVGGGSFDIIPTASDNVDSIARANARASVLSKQQQC